MHPTLTADPVARVLNQLLDKELISDPEEFALAREKVGDRDWQELPVQEVADLCRNIYMSVSRESGELLHLLTRASGARTVVEYGTSFGISTIYFAAAVRDNGGGTVITTEIQRDKAAFAQRSFSEAGVADLIDLRVGDAAETLLSLPDRVDIFLLDGFDMLFMPLIELVEPKLVPGSLVIMDDTLTMKTKGHLLAIDYFANPENGYEARTIAVGDGLHVAMRR